MFYYIISYRNNGNPINFCEILIPRVSYTLYDFIADEDPTSDDTTFKSLNVILEHVKNKNDHQLEKFAKLVNNSMTYQCILCPKIFQGDSAYADVLDHFRFLHKGDQSVLCFKCRQPFEISILCENRWEHQCEERSNDVSKSSSSKTPSQISRPLSNNIVSSTSTIQELLGAPLLTNDNTPTSSVNHSESNTNVSSASVSRRENLFGALNIEIDGLR